MRGRRRDWPGISSVTSSLDVVNVAGLADTPGPVGRRAWSWTVRRTRLISPIRSGSLSTRSCERGHRQVVLLVRRHEHADGRAAQFGVVDRERGLNLESESSARVTGRVEKEPGRVAGRENIGQWPMPGLTAFRGMAIE
jgi:hypothetical protein